jgi:TPR repeat protein
MEKDEFDKLYNEAMEAQDNEDYAKSFSMFLQLAEAGRPDAQNALALAYDSGLGVAQDKGKAIDWLKKGWQISHETMYALNLALTYAEIENRRRAHYWWNKARVFDEPDHGLWYAKFLLQSKGNVNRELVYRLVKQAASEESAELMCESDCEEAQALLKKLDASR